MELRTVELRIGQIFLCLLWLFPFEVNSGHFFRVCAPLRAAATRPALPFVRTALRAAALRDRLPRRRAAVCACRASDALEAAVRPSRRKAEWIARERLRDGFVRGCLNARSALRRVLSEACPFRGAANFTPARRAFERPIAIACFGDRAPCLPFRTCSISSRTNSPACVDADLPARLSRRALAIVFLSGMLPLRLPGLVFSLSAASCMPRKGAGQNRSTRPTSSFLIPPIRCFLQPSSFKAALRMSAYPVSSFVRPNIYGKEHLRSPFEAPVSSIPGIGGPPQWKLRFCDVSFNARYPASTS